MTEGVDQEKLRAIYLALDTFRDCCKGFEHERTRLAESLLLLRAARHLLLATNGPEGGPTDWNETRAEWIAEYERIVGPQDEDGRAFTKPTF